MNISDEGIDLIAKHEGLRLAAYPDPGTGAEPYTIGYGHTGNVQPLDTCTEEQARAWLMEDVQKAVSCVRRALVVTVTQNQFDAMVSLAYNIGCGNFQRSTLLRELNQGNDSSAAAQFLVWNKSAGRVMDGLTARRQDEMELFIS